MATDVTSMSELIQKLSQTKDANTIFEISKEINRASEIAKIKLNDPRAVFYPFTFKKGDIVVQLTDNGVDLESKGEIVDGEYEGTIGTEGWYTIIYRVRRLKDGILYDARDLHLQAVAAS
jgi:hypothetical protein